MTKQKSAIIGCGWSGQKHAESYVLLDSARLTTVVDKNTDKTSEIISKFELPSITQSKNVSEIDSDVSIVSVCTPTKTHPHIVKKVAQSDINPEIILCEKPFASSVDQCHDMISECSKKNIKIVPCHNRLYLQNIKGVSSGNMDFVDIYWNLSGPSRDHWKWNSNREALLWEEGAHIGYIVNEIIPEIEYIDVVGTKTTDGIFDLIKINIHSTGTVLCSVMMSWKQEIGRKLSMNCFQADGEVTKYNLDYNYNSDNDSNIISRGLQYLPSNIGVTNDSRRITGHKSLIQDVVHSVKTDDNIPITSQDGIKSIGFTERVLDSLT